MRFMSPLPKTCRYSSLFWHESQVLKGVRYATRRASLSGRLELLNKVRELVLRNEFLKNGELAEQLEASMADVMVQRLYLEWGLAEINGLNIDGQPATTEMLIEKGPETLTDEIITSVQAELGLSEEERKNS